MDNHATSPIFIYRPQTASSVDICLFGRYNLVSTSYESYNYIISNMDDKRNSKIPKGIIHLWHTCVLSWTRLNSLNRFRINQDPHLYMYDLLFYHTKVCPCLKTDIVGYISLRFSLTSDLFFYIYNIYDWNSNESSV